MYTAANRPDEKSWLQAKLEEYKALRAESMESLRAQHQVLVYSFSLIGLLTAASGQIWDKSSFVATLIFWVAIPTFCYTFTFIWLGEVERFLRVGHYIAELELDVNERVGGDPMGWESHMRGGEEKVRLQLRDNYRAVLFAFLSIAFAAPLAGDAASVNLFNDVTPGRWFSPAAYGYAVAWEMVAVVALCNVIVWFVWWKMYRRLRENGLRIIATYSALRARGPVAAGSATPV
jgi:hypothetical protein